MLSIPKKTTLLDQNPARTYHWGTMYKLADARHSQSGQIPSFKPQLQSSMLGTIES